MNRLISTFRIMALLVSTTVMGQDFQGKAEYFSKFIFKSNATIVEDSEKKEENKELMEAVKIAMKKSSEKPTRCSLIDKKPFMKKTNH